MGMRPGELRVLDDGETAQRRALPDWTGEGSAHQHHRPEHSDCLWVSTRSKRSVGRSSRVWTRREPRMTYELYYWPTIQGRGEFVRLALEETGVEYVDVALQHRGNSGIAGDVLLPAAIPAFRLRPRLSLRLSTPTVLVVLPSHGSETSSIIPLIASNMRPVNSSLLPVVMIQEVGRSSATTRTRRDAHSAFSFSQSDAVRRLSRSTCSTSRTSPGRTSDSSRNNSGREIFAPESFSS